MLNALTDFELDCWIDQFIITDFVTGHECVLNLKDFTGVKGENRISYAGERDYYEE